MAKNQLALGIEDIAISCERTKFKVYVLNDDETPVNLVAVSLSVGFRINSNRIKAIIDEAEACGEGLVGEYFYSMALHRISKAQKVALSNGYNLKFRVE